MPKQLETRLIKSLISAANSEKTQGSEEQAELRCTMCNQQMPDAGKRSTANAARSAGVERKPGNLKRRPLPNRCLWAAGLDHGDQESTAGNRATKKHEEATT